MQLCEIEDGPQKYLHSFKISSTPPPPLIMTGPLASAIGMSVYIWKLLFTNSCLLHMCIADNFTPVDRARVSQGKFSSWLADISTISGEILVKWGRQVAFSAVLADRASPMLVKRPLVFSDNLILLQ